MEKWNFPSKNHGEIEGFSSPGLEFFKGNPLKALAREVCQNSLDACKDPHKPVRIEFKRHIVTTQMFPGNLELMEILHACQKFWETKGNEKTNYFLKRAREVLCAQQMSVLRISDYNTVGLQGAFKKDEITPWLSLVKGSAVSIKHDESNAGGSYGIGHAAPFVNSEIQTVFYRTRDTDNVTAVQGVARLMAFVDEDSNDVDKVRRSTGYYGNPVDNMPVPHMGFLDRLAKRTETGTDLFIPGFNSNVQRLDWKRNIICEILENFLMAIFNRKLEVLVEDEIIDKEYLENVIIKNEKNAKNARCFHRILKAKTDDIVLKERDFYGMGKLVLRLMYTNNLNKQILVVRKNGMKISTIPGLPKGISYTGILELRGDRLNEFFREMETPQHNKWEPKRHKDQNKATEYKTELEDWVKYVINETISEIAGDESLIYTGDCFATQTPEEHTNVSTVPEVSTDVETVNTRENILDSNKALDILIEKKTSTRGKGKIKVSGGGGKNRKKGIIDDVGDKTGHRRRTGTRPGGQPTGRLGREDESGPDEVYAGDDSVMGYVEIRARVINIGDGMNRLVVVPSSKINQGEITVVSMGENGMALPLRIYDIKENTKKACVRNGKIIVNNIAADEKVVIEFTIKGKQVYAMGVEMYGN